MVIHYQPERLRRHSDQPTAITDVLIATSGSSYTGDIPLGTPTCSTRSRQGRWALYPTATRSWLSGRVVPLPDHRSRSPPSWTGLVTARTTWPTPPSGRSNSS
jgi:hypothetical protein